MAATRFLESNKIVIGAVPIDTTGAAVSGDYVSLKNYEHLTIVIVQGAWAAGTPAVTLKQAVDVAGTSEKALSFTKYWSGVALTQDLLTGPVAVVSDTFNLTATASTFTIIEVDSSALDVDNNFDCVRLGIASPGANADLICVVYILSFARYPQASPPSAIID
jgi:hypothetical protein